NPVVVIAVTQSQTGTGKMTITVIVAQVGGEADIVAELSGNLSGNRRALFRVLLLRKGACQTDLRRFQISDLAHADAQSFQPCGFLNPGTGYTQRHLIGVVQSVAASEAGVTEQLVVVEGQQRRIKVERPTIAPQCIQLPLIHMVAVEIEE